eukprot:TRINITY_DN14638_c0_g1_i1.p1 TRINITY_DN14638_c0_g1~~TRINITY_DN14638_c0_g1_i1.p1  ORF type:complete len:153 (-),score=24.68 TRINITY_DN14638_c0_g1_i1:11-469(-)
MASPGKLRRHLSFEEGGMRIIDLERRPSLRSAVSGRMERRELSQGEAEAILLHLSKKKADAPADPETCLICFDKTPDSVFMKCGHGGLCYDCAIDIWEKHSECHLCRGEISEVLQVEADPTSQNVAKIVSTTRLMEEAVSYTHLTLPTIYSV